MTDAELIALGRKAAECGWTADHLDDLKRMVPDVDGLITRNPLSQVMFRAGLLACREYMARYVEQGGDATTAQSIRANWWPVLGDDPGAPRLFDFNEIVEEKTEPGAEVRWESKPISPSVEALPRAFHFINAK